MLSREISGGVIPVCVKMLLELCKLKLFILNSSTAQGNIICNAGHCK